MLARTTKLIRKLLHIYVWRRFRRFSVSPSLVPKLSIEVTNLCNANCVFCANSAMTRKVEAMDMALFRKAADDYVAMGGHSLDFNVIIGDPLLDRKLLDRAEYVRDHTALNSNGFVTTLQWLHLHDLDRFFAAGFTWINVSTVLAGRDAYRSFFRVDKYDKMLANLKTLLQENNRRGRPLAVYVKLNPVALPAEQVLAHPDFQAIQALSSQAGLSRQVTEALGYVDDWLGAVTLPKHLKRRPLFPRRRHPCQLLYHKLIVYSNGKVGACSCRDFNGTSELVLGDLRTASLGELWHGEKLARTRRDWIEGRRIPEICNSCRHYVYD